MGSWEDSKFSFYNLIAPTSLNLESLRTVADEALPPLLKDDTEGTAKELHPTSGCRAMKLEGNSGHLSFLMAGNICLRQNYEDTTLFFVSSLVSQYTNNLFSGASRKLRLTC